MGLICDTQLKCHSVLCIHCHYAECHYAECHYAECHYADCHYAECRDYLSVMLNVVMPSVVMLMLLY
jgi:hypothetical protein